MSPREDVEKIRAAGKIIEAMEAKYESLLFKFGNEVLDRHPRENQYARPLHAYRELATGAGSYTLAADCCTDDHIAFRDFDGDLYLLPVLWLTEPEAWHVNAAEEEAKYQAAERNRKVRTRQQKISELQEQIRKLEAAQ